MVFCAVSGFGQTGPYRERAGHDLNYLALAGVLDLTGSADGAPVAAGVQVADNQTAALAAAAVLARERTRQGAFVDASLLDAAHTSPRTMPS